MLAIIGGTGLYELPGMQIEERSGEPTPFGTPSGELVRGSIGGQPLLFLARHGSGHRLLPHEVNYRANIFALKRAGATMVLGFSAVGSLALEVAPGDFAMPEQYFDWTRGVRERSFFGGGVAAHVSMRSLHRRKRSACRCGAR
jgi:5'-methylthioadenosine phosphorylase